MPIQGIVQPDIIEISEKLRLRKYDGKYDFALRWYLDTETVKLVDGAEEPYDEEKLTRMYSYLNERGELYFIETKENNEYIPIGDVTLWDKEVPVVIGDRDYRQKGIGRNVVSKLIERARKLGFENLYATIYTYNTGSQRLFEGLGFERYEKVEKGYRYRLAL